MYGKRESEGEGKGHHVLSTTEMMSSDFHLFFARVCQWCHLMSCSSSSHWAHDSLWTQTWLNGHSDNAITRTSSSPSHLREAEQCLASLPFLARLIRAQTSQWERACRNTPEWKHIKRLHTLERNAAGGESVWALGLMLGFFMLKNDWRHHARWHKRRTDHPNMNETDWCHAAFSFFYNNAEDIEDSPDYGLKGAVQNSVF